MKTANLYFIIFLFPLLCLGQSTPKLKGQLTDGAVPLPWENIVVSSSNGTITGGTTSNEEGVFELDIDKGTYKVTITAQGFTSWEKDMLIDRDIDLGMIVLSRKAIDLDEVVIKTQKKTIVQKTDRLVYNLENTIVTTGGNALGAINTAPGVVVQNNSINILGKGASRVMIDGRMVELSGEELNNFLRSIAAGDIKNVEIITNPPAKYDANGTGGIININLKKGVRDSWKNTATLSYDQNKFGIYTVRNSFFYNKNNFRFSVSGNAKTGYKNATEDLKLSFPDGLQHMKSTSKMNEENLSGKIALAYDISGHTTIGIQYLRDGSNPNFKSDVTILNYTPENTLNNVLINNGFNDKYTGSESYNFHLVTQLDSLGKKLSVDADYFKYDSDFDRDFTTKNYTPDMVFVSLDQSGKNVSDQDIENKSIKADMEHPFEFLNLSYGAKISFIKSSSGLLYYNTINENAELDSNQSNQFAYKENNQAVYISGEKTFNGAFTVQIGLRAENTQTSGYSANVNHRIENRYLKLFPTFYLSYKKDDNNSINFNYGKRINRPRFELLNPFRTYINSNSYSEGNPFLQPSFSNNFELSHSYKELLRTSVFLNFINDGYGVIFTSNPATNTQVVTRDNYYISTSYGIGENYSAGITEWWQNETSLYVLGSKTRFTSAINAIPTNGLQFDFSTSNTFSLGETTKLQVEYTYTAPYKVGLYSVGYASGLNIAFKQNLLSKNMQVAVLVNDVFNTAYLKDFASVVNGVKQVYSQNESSRFFRVSLIYNFGNNKIDLKQRSFGNEDEKRRIGK